MNATRRSGSRVQTIIIGSSAAGLACARCLQQKGLEYIILEEQDQVGFAWLNHYDRLHLHTPRSCRNFHT